MRLDGAMKDDMNLVKKSVIMQLPDDENGRKVQGPVAESSTDCAVGTFS